MGKISDTGRMIYGTAIAGIGLTSMYYKDFPYLLFPGQPALLSGLVSVFGILFILAGAFIVPDKMIRPVGLLFGSLLLLIFCFYHIPYEFGANTPYKNLLEWDNAGKELALAGGAFAVAGIFSGKNKNHLSRFGDKLLPFGAVLYSIPIILFGILHLLYAKDVSTMVPAWIPAPVFWTYLAGIGLLGGGLAIILRIRSGLPAALLGLMILSWFVILHIPRIIHAPVTDLEGEVTSAFLALAYSGTAFVIAGAAGKTV